MITNPDPLLNTNDAAPYVGENPKSLANKRSRGEGPDYIKVGRLVRYRQSALNRYLDEREVRLGGGDDG